MQIQPLNSINYYKNLSICALNKKDIYIRKNSLSFLGEGEEIESGSNNISPTIEERERVLKERFAKLKDLDQQLKQKEKELAAREICVGEKEQELNERLNAADAYFELERSNMRVAYGCDDSSVKIYVSPAEQMLNVANFMNRHANIFPIQDRSNALSLIEILKNKEGKIHAEVLKFLDRIFEIKDAKADLPMIKAIIDSVINEEGGIDAEKGAVFIGNYTLKQETLSSTLKVMKDTYFANTGDSAKEPKNALDKLLTEEKQKEEAKKRAEEEKAKREEAARLKAEEESRPIKEEIIKRINSQKTFWKNIQKYNAYIGKDGLIEIDTNGRFLDLYKIYGGNIKAMNEAFKYIGVIHGDLDLQFYTSGINLGSLKRIDGNVNYLKVPEYKPIGIDNVSVGGLKHGVIPIDY